MREKGERCAEKELKQRSWPPGRHSPMSSIISNQRHVHV